MSKGGDVLGGVGDFAGSLLKNVGQIFAPQTTQAFLNAPLLDQQRQRMLGQGNALDQIVQGLSGNQPAQTSNIDGQNETVPAMKMSTQTLPQLPQSAPTGRMVSPMAGLPAVPEILTDKSQPTPPGGMIGSTSATPMTGGYSPTSGVANFMQNQLPGLAFKADPETMIKSMQQRAVTAQLVDSIPGITDQQRAILKVSGPEGMKAFVENSAQGFPTIPENIKLLNTYQKMQADNPNDPRLPFLKNEIDKAGGMETDPDKIAATRASTNASNASAANSGLVETKDAFGNPGVMNKTTGKFTAGSGGGLQTVGDEDIQSNAKMIANYQKPAPSGAGAMRPFNLKLMEEVSKFNPDYNAQNYVASQKAYSDFSAGKLGAQTKKFNVATSHMMLLRAYGNALDNGDMNLANAAKNKLSDEFGGVPIAGYDAIAPLVADEVAGAVIGGPTALQDRAEFVKSFLSNKGNDARNAAIDARTGAMVGQLHGLKQQYERGTMRKDFGTWLSPEVAKMIDDPRFDINNPNIAQPGGVAPGTTPDANHPAAAAAGIPEPAKRVVGQVYPTARGSMQWTGTGWLPAAAPSAAPAAPADMTPVN